MPYSKEQTSIQTPDNTVENWLAGNPVDIDGLMYVFPHGSSKIRRLLHERNEWFKRRLAGISIMKQLED